MKDIIINGKIYTNISKLNFKNDLGKTITFVEESEYYKPTSARLFTFSGSSITGYNGDDQDIVLPKSYSLGEIITKQKIFNTYEEFSIYATAVSLTFPLTAIDAFGNEITILKLGYARYEEYPLSVSVEEQEFVDGEDFIVDTIARASFYKNQHIKSVVMLDNIINIGDSAFYLCQNIEKVKIGKNVTTIDSWIFANCENLAVIEVDESNTKYDSRDNCNAIIETATNTLYAGCPKTIIPLTVTTLGYGCLSYFNSIYSIDIPDNIIVIGDYAFSDNTNLDNVIIPDSVTSIGSYTFCRCTSLSTINLSNNLTNIGEGSFYNCTKLNNLSIPNNVTTLGKEAFKLCSSLTSIIIHDNIISMGESVFESCDNLTTAIIGNGITTIPKSAFRDCYRLNNLSIGNRVKTIGASAFISCQGLTSVTIPSSVTSIVGQAFDFCYRLVEVINKSSLSIRAGVFISNGYIGQYAKQIITNASQSKLRTTADGFVIYDDTLLVDYIGKNTSAIIPETITSIHQYAFADKDYLTYVSIPNSVESIGDEIFKGCINLNWYIDEENDPENNLKYLGNENNKYIYLVGVSNKNLTRAVLHSTTKFIGTDGLGSCYNLTECILPESLLMIDYRGISFCSNLKSLTIPRNVKYLGRDVLTGSGITSVIFENTEGWYYYANPISSGSTTVTGKLISSSSLANPSTAASYLKTYGTYNDGYWVRT